MNNFWSSELGVVSGLPRDTFGIKFELIPEGTRALAKINNFILKDFMGNKYYEIDWLLSNGVYAQRHVFQKIQAFHDDPKRRHRALNMLRLIYNILGVAPNAGAPDDNSLKVFINKIAGIVINETSPNEQGKSYNWVAEVHHPVDFAVKDVERANVPRGIATSSATSNFKDDIDVPF